MRAVKILVVLLLVILAVASGLLTWLWMAPDSFARAVLKVIPSPQARSIQFDSLRGNPVDGYEIDNIRIPGEKGETVIPHIELNLDWWRLLRGKVQLKKVNLNAFGMTVTGTGSSTGFNTEVKGTWDLKLEKPVTVVARIEGHGQTLETLQATGTWAAHFGDTLWADGTLRVADQKAGFDLIFRSLNKGRGSGTVNLHTKAHNLDLRVDLTSSSFLALLGKSPVDAAQVAIAGSTRAHTFSFSISTAGRSFEGGGRGRMAGQSWKGNLTVRNADIGQLDLEGSVSNQRAEIEAFSLQRKEGRIIGSASVPFDLVSNPRSTARVVLKSNQFDVGALLREVTDLKIENPMLTADLVVERKENTLSAQGPLSLSAASFSYPAMGLELKDIRFAVEGEGRKLVIKQAEAKSGKKGTVHLGGSADFNSPEIRLLAKRLGLKMENGFSAELDVDLMLAGGWDSPLIKGMIDVSGADYQPTKTKDKKKAEKQKAKSPPPRSAPPTQNQLRLDIDVHFDRDVWFKEKQTSVELKGDLQIRKEALDSPRLFGTVQSVRGDYVLYGRSFKIERGMVFFSGDVPVNPTIDLEAVYKDQTNQLRVYLTATGTLEEPRLTLRSEPPLEESDIIAVLVTGRPMNASGQGDSDSRALAEQALAGYLSEKVRQELQDSVALDVLRVDVKENQVSELTVGKNVTDKVFVSYGQTLGEQAERRLRAEYLFTDHWSLEGNTSTVGRYVIDLLFRFGFK